VWCRWSSENTFYLVQVEFRKYLLFGAGGVQKIPSIWCRWSSENIFYLLQVEFRKYLLFGFIEGIWYLDIIYQGERPGQVRFTFYSELI
jgi:hypothetical protein